MNEHYLDTEFQRADELIAKDLIEESKAVLNSILEEDPNYGKAHNHLGWIAKVKENDPVTAENHYKHALVSVPEYGATYLNYAYLLSEQKRYYDLEQILQQAENIADVSKNSLAREWAYMYEDTKQYEKAIEKYKEYALTLYDSPLLEKAKEAIMRCRQKLEILNL